MSVKHKRSNAAWSIPGGVAVGLSVSMAIMLLCSALLAWLIVTQKMDISSIGYGCGMILIFSSAVGAWLTTTKVKVKQLLITGIFAGCYYLLLLGMTALLFGGQYQGMGVTAICVFLGAGGTLLLTLVPNKSRKKGAKIRAYR